MTPLASHRFTRSRRGAGPRGFLGWPTLALPFLGYLALRTFEDVDDVIGDLRAIAHRIFRRYGYARLVAQREAIRGEMLQVAREMA